MDRNVVHVETAQFFTISHCYEQWVGVAVAEVENRILAVSSLHLVRFLDNIFLLLASEQEAS